MMLKNISLDLNSADRFRLQDEDSRSTSASSEDGTGGIGDTSSCAGQSSCDRLSFFNCESVLQIEAPPGLPLPSEFQSPDKSRCGFRPPPGLDVPSHLLPAVHGYTVQGFRREANNILKELKMHKNVGLAVSQVRLQQVPFHRQAAEFADILTMVLEETRGPARRVCVAFVGGLTKAFELENCILGLQAFFKEIYEDLQIEVPDLSKRIASELLPTLKPLLEAKDFARIASLRDSCT